MKFILSILLTASVSLNGESSILCIGDSITAGGKSFKVYRYPLYQQMKKAGYKFKFTGSLKSIHKGTELRHNGYGGKNTAFLKENIKEIYKKSNADFVLIHSGHNSFAKDKPINNIISCTKEIIIEIKRQNPGAVIMVAAVIPSGKLPKYSYIPELNLKLKDLCKKEKVVCVDMAQDFNWKSDTVADKVHPNQQGAEKMARCWFEALKKFEDRFK